MPLKFVYARFQWLILLIGPTLKLRLTTYASGVTNMMCFYLGICKSTSEPWSKTESYVRDRSKVYGNCSWNQMLESHACVTILTVLTPHENLGWWKWRSLLHEETQSRIMVQNNINPFWWHWRTLLRLIWQLSLQFLSYRIRPQNANNKIMRRSASWQPVAHVYGKLGAQCWLNSP